MTQMKNEQLLTGYTIEGANGVPRNSVPQKDNQSDSGALELDLTVIARQLVAIASALQGSDQAKTRAPTIGDPPHLRHGLSGNATSSTDRDTVGAAPIGFHNARSQRQNNIATARLAYTNRRARAAIFGNAELFGEPAWDILLDLYIAYGEGKPVSVSSACIGSAAPPTTGLRWLGVLAENDLVLREHDPEDQRRVLVRLTEKGLAAMDEYFASAGEPT